MRVLISAYACEPDKGSEPGVGFEIVKAAAREHEVWLITRVNNADSVRRGLSTAENAQVHVVPFDLAARALAAKKALGRFGIHPYYDLWQRKIGPIARALDRDIEFDVVHHATFATYWTRIGVAAVPKPLVVGPVGGAAVSPLGMVPTLGVRGFPGEAGRRLLRPVLARVSGARAALAGARVVLVQNPDMEREMGGFSTRLLPNGLLGAVEVAPSGAGDNPPVVHAARLLGWKGGMLAVAAWRDLGDDAPDLHIFGDGPDRRRLERAIRRWGLEGRVFLRGVVSRETLIREVAMAGAMIHPALHDDSSLAVAEALSLGTPLVCLDLAGLPVLAGYWPNVSTRVVSASTPRRTASALAAAVLEVYGRRAAPDAGPRRLFVEGVLTAYESARSQ